MAHLVGGYLCAQPLLPYYLLSLCRHLIFMFSTSYVFVITGKSIKKTKSKSHDNSSLNLWYISIKQDSCITTIYKTCKTCVFEPIRGGAY